MELGSQGAGHKPGGFGPEQLCPGEAGADLVFLHNDESYGVGCQAWCHVLEGASLTPGSPGSGQTGNMDMGPMGRGLSQGEESKPTRGDLGNS